MHQVLVIEAALVSIHPALGQCSGTLVLTCNLGEMPSGVSVSIQVSVIPNSAGVIHNTATVSREINDPQPDNNLVSIDRSIAKNWILLPVLSRSTQ